MNKPFLSITLPLPPSWNSLYCRGKYGQIYMSSKGKKYKQSAVAAIKDAMEDKKVSPYDGDVWVEYIIWLRDIHASDADNRFKIINDSLEASGLIIDDCYIIGGTFIKRECAKKQKQCIEIHIYKYDED